MKVYIRENGLGLIYYHLFKDFYLRKDTNNKWKVIDGSWIIFDNSILKDYYPTKEASYAIIKAIFEGKYE